jgi:phosphoglycolate phosphatase-like HAD superfamily hydrolase
MVIVFDVDGTLIGGEEQDWPSFDAALFAEFDYHPDAEFWKGMEEITGRAIIQRVAEVTGREADEACEQRVRAAYLANLRRAAPFKGSIFTPKPGAREILQLLRKTPVFDVAIATGDFAETSRFKLASAGLDVSGIPFASSSDAGVRSQIIERAVERAKVSIVDAVYVGDGPWDLRACRQLEIPFIGTGRRLDRLKEAGAEFLVEDLQPENLLPLLNLLLRMD